MQVMNKVEYFINTMINKSLSKTQEHLSFKSLLIQKIKKKFRFLLNPCVQILSSSLCASGGNRRGFTHTDAGTYAYACITYFS